MATDTWQTAREGLTRLWRGIQPHRAEIIASEMEAGRDDVLAARMADDRETLSELRSEWQGRFRRLLAAHPEVAGELRGFLDEFGPPGGVPLPAVSQHGTASGSARVYQAGRDQHITER